MHSDIIATAAPIGVAVLDWATGHPYEVADLAVELVLGALAVMGGLLKMAWIPELGKRLVPSMIREPIARKLAERKRAGR